VRAALAAANYFRASAPAQRPTEITLFSDAQESALLLSALIANPAKDKVNDFAHALAREIPQLTGVEFTSAGVAGRQPQAVARWGESSLNYRTAGGDYRVDQGAFFQVNRWLIDALVERVTAARQGSVAWDLFAGVGLFARRLSAGFEQVIAVESAPAAIPSLEANLSGTCAAAVPSSALEFVSRKSERPDLIVPDLIVADPPRTGLGAEVTAQLTRIGAPRIIYVSCDPATLARDLRAMVAGGYAIESLALADLFPQTYHIEAVVHLRRA
jgi:23S rRNA (uracil1939-C5)-methyltransferase